MSYKPDPSALPTGTPFIRQLSQRDVALQIPINYVTTPGVVLTPACFAHGRYDSAAAEKCFSNLLAVGFDRFEIDVYWDVSRSVWSLCPVELGEATSGANPSTPHNNSTNAVARDDNIIDTLRGKLLGARQQSSSLSVPSGTSQQKIPSSTRTSPSTTATLSSITSTATPSIPSSTGDGTLIHIGPYSCTSTCTLFPLARVLNGHLHSTQNNLNATLKYLILNLHVAAQASDPTGSAKNASTSDLPTGNSLVSNVLTAAINDYLYTPNDLRSERSDLNGSQSWFGSVGRYHPDSAYFRVQGSGVHFSTQDGWPPESFVEMEFAKRMLAGYGQIDLQLAGYNLSADASTIFESGYLQSNTSATISDQGVVDTGCFYQPDMYSISGVNNSWATSARLVAQTGGSAQLQSVFAEASNLTYCGISPILNETLGQVTADTDFSPYKNYVQSTIWSWAPHEPRNATDRDDDHSRTNHRCAVLSAITGYWETEDCGQSHYSACRSPTETYRWVIGNSEATYADAQLPCPDGTDFSVPRTALENTYLLHQWRKTADIRSTEDKLLWLNFNDLNAKNCWVIGQNTTCPYLPQPSNEQQVVVPTIAAVIVFVLAALTMFVKCAANRRQSKRRRRRGDDGWDYEGVPS